MIPVYIRSSLPVLLILLISCWGMADINETAPIEVNATHADLLFTTDLALTGSITPSTVEMGSPLSAVIGVMNAGPAPAEKIRINYYLVRYNESEAVPIWIHQKVADLIPAFYQDTVSFTINTPSGIAPGRYNLYTTISTTATDRNLSNNEFLSQAPIEIRQAIPRSTTGLPDLSLKIDSVSSIDLASGYPLTIGYTVMNTGDGEAGTFHVGFYLSPDPDIDPSDLKLWDEVYYQASPNMAESGVATDLVPADIPPGEYYLGGIVDFTNMVLESDKDTNVFRYDTPVVVHDLSHPVDEAFLEKVAGYLAVKTNLYRQYRGLPELSYDHDLSEIARMHSIDMASRQFFSHETPEGTDPTGRAEAAKYTTVRRLSDGTIRTGIAENIVKISGGYIIGFGYSGFVDSSNPEAVADVMMIEWISSPEHNKNLIHTDVDRIGVGVAYDGDYFIATQNFY